MIRVTDENGTVHNFPDGTSEAEITHALDKWGKYKSLATGMLKGGAAVLGAPGDIQQGLDEGVMRPLAKSFGGDLPRLPAGLRLPTSSGIVNTIAKPFGGVRQALTPGEKLAEDAGSIGTAALMSPGSLPSRVMTGVTGGFGAGAADIAIPDKSPWKPDIMALGAMGGGMAANMLERPFGVVRPPAAIPGRPDISPKMAQRGTNYVLQHLNRAGVSPSNLGTGAPNIPEFTTAETLGPGAVDSTLTLASRPGTTAADAASLVARRNEGRRGRVFDAFENATGIHPEDADANLDIIVHQGQSIASPLYDRITQNRNPVMTARLAALLKRGRIAGAVKDVIADLDTRGIDPASEGLPSSGPLKPTAMAWDLIKKHLQAQVKRDGVGRVMADSAAPGNVGIASATATLTDELKNTIPGYADALKASGDYLSIGTAFRNGQKVIDGTKFTPNAIAQIVDRLQPGDRYGFYAGMASRLFGKSNVETTLATNGPLQAKIIAALGAQRGQELIDTAKAELAAMRSGNRMVPRNQSATAGIQQGILDQDQIDRAHGMVDAAHAVGHALTGNYLGAAGPALRLATRMSRAGTMPEDARNAAGHLMLLPPSNTAQYLQQIRPVSRQAPPPMSPQTIRMILMAHAASQAGRR